MGVGVRKIDERTLVMFEISAYFLWVLWWGAVMEALREALCESHVEG